MINDGATRNGSAKIHLEKGDYATQTLEIPRMCNVELFSKDRVRLLYSGKRNRPLFVLSDRSALVIREKVEIYYNTNNVQEAMKLMIRSPPSARIEIDRGVKISPFSYKPGT